MRDHACWIDEPWMAYGLWSRAPQGKSYMQSLTESVEVLAPAIVEVTLVHPHYDSCMGDNGDCSGCAAAEYAAESGLLQMGYAELVDTIPVFEAAYANWFQTSWAGFDQMRLELPDPLLHYQPLTMWSNDGDRLCGPVVLLDATPYEWNYEQVPPGEVGICMDGTSVDSQTLIPTRTGLPPYEVVSTATYPDLRQMFLNDRDRIDDLATSPLTESAIRQVSAELKNLQAIRAFDEIVAQQRADWIQMLKEVDDECGYSQLQSLVPRHLAYSSGAHRAS